MLFSFVIFFPSGFHIGEFLLTFLQVHESFSKVSNLPLTLSGVFYVSGSLIRSFYIFSPSLDFLNIWQMVRITVLRFVCKF